MSKLYWTFDKCKEIALRYNRKIEFLNGDKLAYNASYKKGWLDLICDHMLSKKENWTTERCVNVALLYKYKKDFRKECPSAYYYAHRNGLIDLVCLHMERIGNSYNRCVYVYVFPDNSVYVGLTYNLKIRNRDHLAKDDSSVFNHIQLTKLVPMLFQVSDYINKNDAVILEDKIVEEYKLLNFNILNIAKPGALGSNKSYWTKEKCREVALFCKTTSEFKKMYVTAHSVCNKNNWLREICSHMKICKPNGYWTKEKCHEVSLKYKYISDFMKFDVPAFSAAKRNEWVSDICSHMVPKGYRKSSWDKNRCYEESKKYSRRTKFANGCRTAYIYSRINLWLDEFYPKIIP